MSEEVVIASEVQSGTFFVLTLDSMVALLDKENARGLRDDLNEFLEVDKVDANATGVTFPKGVREPIGLAIGTLLVDNDGDVAKRVVGGWSWHKLDGYEVKYPSVFDWEEIQNSVTHKEFRVIA